MKYYRDLNNVVDTSRQGGLEGIAQGRKAEKIAIARSLISKLPTDIISQTTGLTIAEITRLQSDTQQD